MADFDDLIEALEGAGSPPEHLAHVLKVEDLLGSLTSLDFNSLTSVDFNLLSAKFKDAGSPAEAIAQLEKIKSLLITD